MRVEARDLVGGSCPMPVDRLHIEQAFLVRPNQGAALNNIGNDTDRTYF